CEQRGNVQIAVACGRRSNADTLIRQTNMHGVGVGGGMHGDRRNAELLAGAQHPQRDLSAIGDEDFIEHRLSAAQRAVHSTIIITSPNSTGWPSSTRICVTVPARGAGIWFMVFIASMMRSVSPALTLLPTSTKSFAPGEGAR